MAQHDTNSPAVLLDAQGRQLSSLLQDHARDFTLLFLHHTIEGTSLGGQQLIEARILGVQEAPSLIVTPAPEEIETYGHKAVKRGLPAAPLDLTRHPEDMVEHNFIRNHARLTNRGGLKEMVETHRQAMALAAQHTLDCAARQDQEGFNRAYRDIEAVISIGIRLIDPQLRDEGMPREERRQFLSELHERALGGAISNRLASMDDVQAERKLYETYEEYMAEYQEAQKPPAPHDGPLHGSEQTPVRETDDPAMYKSEKPFTVRVKRGGRDLINGFTANAVARNDNERAR